MPGTLGNFIGNTLYRYDFENIPTGGAALRCTPSAPSLCKTDPETQQLDCSNYEKSAQASYAVFHYHMDGKPYRCIVDAGQPEDQEPLTNDCDGLSSSMLACNSKFYKGKKLCAWGKKNLYDDSMNHGSQEGDVLYAGDQDLSIPTYSECVRLRRLRYEHNLKEAKTRLEKEHDAKDDGNEGPQSDLDPNAQKEAKDGKQNGKKSKGDDDSAEDDKDDGDSFDGSDEKHDEDDDKDNIEEARKVLMDQNPPAEENEFEMKKIKDVLDRQWIKCAEQGFEDSQVLLVQETKETPPHSWGKSILNRMSRASDYGRQKFMSAFFGQTTEPTPVSPKNSKGFIDVSDENLAPDKKIPVEKYARKCQSVCTTQTWEDCDSLVCSVDPQSHKCKPRLFPVISPGRVPDGSSLGFAEEEFTPGEIVYANTRLPDIPVGTRGKVIAVQQVNNVEGSNGEQNDPFATKTPQEYAKAENAFLNMIGNSAKSRSKWHKNSERQYLIMLQQAGERFDRKLKTYLTGMHQPAREVTFHEKAMRDPFDLLHDLKFMEAPKRLVPKQALALAFEDMKDFIHKRKAAIHAMLNELKETDGEDAVKPKDKDGSGKLFGGVSDWSFRLFGITGDGKGRKQVVTPKNREVIVRFFQEDGESGEKIDDDLLDDANSTIVKTSAEKLSHANEATIRYKSDRHIASSSLIDDPFKYSCGWVGQEGKHFSTLKRKQNSELMEGAGKDEMHPEIVMREPFSWMRVKLSDVDNPADVRWNAVYTFPKPVYRLSAYAKPNSGATAHFYDPEFFNYPYLPNFLQKLIAAKGLNAPKSTAWSRLGRMFDGAMNSIRNKANPYGNKPRATAMHKAPDSWTSMFSQEARDQYLAPHQRVVNFKPLCGSKDKGKRRLFDLSVVTDGMLGAGASSPGFDPSLKEFYDYVKGQAYLDMTRRSGGLDGAKAKLANEEINEARRHMKGNIGTGVKPPNELDYSEYDKNEKILSSKPSVFEMLTDSPLLLPSGIRKKLKDADFWSDSLTTQSNYPIFSRDEDDEPFYYGDHVGIEVSTPHKLTSEKSNLETFKDETSYDIAKFFPRVIAKTQTFPERDVISPEKVTELESAVIRVYPDAMARSMERAGKVVQNSQSEAGEITANTTIDRKGKVVKRHDEKNESEAKAMGLYFPTALPVLSDVDRVSLWRMDRGFRDIINLSSEALDAEELDPKVKNKLYVGLKIPPNTQPAWNERFTGNSAVDRQINKKMMSVWKQM